MAQYVDGFVIPIPKKNMKAYKKLAQLACKVWMKHGALAYYECQGEEFMNYGTGFKKMCKLKPTETVVFAFIVYSSKSHRNKVNKKVMSDPTMKMESMIMPFDMKRFSMAGCDVIVKSLKK